LDTSLTPQVKQELWQTMKALAELELRERAHAAAHAQAQDEQKQVFEQFRSTIAQEAGDIRTLQEQMRASHSAALQQLGGELAAAAGALRNYTDAGLVGVRGRLGALTALQEEDRRRVLAHVADTVAALQERVGALHAEALAGAEAARAFAQGVARNVTVGDARLEAEVRKP